MTRTFALLCLLTVAAAAGCSSSEPTFGDATPGTLDARADRASAPNDGPAAAEGRVPPPDTGADRALPGAEAGPADGPAPDASAPDASGTGETLNTGDTSGDQAAAGAPGAPCSNDGQCADFAGTGQGDDQGAVCVRDSEGFPGGYCSFLCSLPTSGNYGCNAAGGVYVPYSSSWGDGYCYHPCKAPNDCRVGYRCVDGACMPDCLQYACKVGTCDASKHVCLAK